MQENRLVLPLAIVGAGMILAISLYYYLHEPEPAILTTTDLAGEMRPLDDSDHILGNPAAPIMFVEYSDIDSPFSKVFEKSLRGVISEYGDEGTVAWTYRHLPIIEQHPWSQQHAEAAECANAQGGAFAFFRFVEELHLRAPGSNEFDPRGYEQVIEAMGLDTDAFSSCVDNRTYANRVGEDAQNALSAGAIGAPYTIMLVKDEEPVTIEGLITGDQLKVLIDAALDRLGE